MEEIFNEADYQKGFNEGYLISKYMPDLAEKLAKTELGSERGSGFKDGREQMQVELEQKKSKYPSWMRDKNHEPAHGKDEKSITKDIEPEKDTDMDKER